MSMTSKENIKICWHASYAQYEGWRLQKVRYSVFKLLVSGPYFFIQDAGDYLLAEVLGEVSGQAAIRGVPGGSGDIIERPR